MAQMGVKKIKIHSQFTDADFTHASGSSGSLQGMSATRCHKVGAQGQEGAFPAISNERLKMPSAAHEKLGILGVFSASDSSGRLSRFLNAIVDGAGRGALPKSHA